MQESGSWASMSFPFSCCFLPEPFGFGKWPTAGSGTQDLLLALAEDRFFPKKIVIGLVRDEFAPFLTTRFFTPDFFDNCLRVMLFIFKAAVFLRLSQIWYLLHIFFEVCQPPPPHLHATTGSRKPKCPDLAPDLGQCVMSVRSGECVYGTENCPKCSAPSPRRRRILRRNMVRGCAGLREICLCVCLKYEIAL